MIDIGKKHPSCFIVENTYAIIIITIIIIIIIIILFGDPSPSPSPTPPQQATYDNSGFSPSYGLMG